MTAETALISLAAIDRVPPQEEVLRRGLPKWPQMLTFGRSVGLDRAKEIIRRTDTFFQTPGYCGNDHAYNRRVMRLLKIPDTSASNLHDPKVWEAFEAWRKTWGYIDTEYVHNSWISTSFVGGPHGWCCPDGTILFVDNVGKWPSVESVLSDWSQLANEFPFLDLAAVLMDGEQGEDRPITPIAGIRVKDGMARVFDAGSVDLPRVQRDFEHAIEHGPVGGGLAAEHGIPWEWLVEWSKQSRTIAAESEAAG